MSIQPISKMSEIHFVKQNSTYLNCQWNTMRKIQAKNKVLIKSNADNRSDTNSVSKILQFGLHPATKLSIYMNTTKDMTSLDTRKLEKKIQRQTKIHFQKQDIDFTSSKINEKMACTLG